MSVQNPPARLWVKTVDTSEIVQMGGLSPDVHGEIGYGKLWLWKKGAHAGTEKVRVNCYSDSDYSKLMFSSAWSNIYDLATITASDWYGWIRVDFSRQHQNKNLTYYWAAEFTGYTRNGETFYLAIPFDYPVRIYSDATNSNRRLAFEILPYEDLAA